MTLHAAPSDRKQVGPTLWWQFTEPRVGDSFEHFGERHEVTEFFAEGGGWCFVTRIGKARKNEVIS